jgi:hypothetical protein
MQEDFKHRDNPIFIYFSVISSRVHTVISYTSGITEAYYNVLTLTNGDWLLWQYTHFQQGQVPVNISLPSHSSCLPPFTTFQNSCNLAQQQDGMKAEFKCVSLYEHAQFYI